MSSTSASTRADADSTALGQGRVSAAFIALYGLVFFGLYAALLAPAVVALAVRAQQLFPASKAPVLSLVLGTGALVAVLANPVAGLLSDRVTRTGRRRPFLIGGVVVGTLGMLIVALSTAVPTLVLGFCTAQLGYNVVLAALYAVLPDVVPTAQRGRVSGVAGVGLALGLIGGIFLAQAFAGNPLLLFLAPALPALVTVPVFAAVLGRRDRPADPAVQGSLRFAAALRSFWISPRAAPDFWWAFAGRFLILLALALLTTYQLYFLTDQLRVPTARAPFAVFQSTLIYTLGSVVGSVLVGFLSDRGGRRKAFALATALLYAAGILLIDRSTGLNAFFVGMLVVGLGQGAYLAVDQALVSQVLPDPASAAKDLGLFNIANALPQSVAPAIAPIFLAIGAAGGNYVALLLAGTVFAVIGAVLVQPIRSVR